MNLDDLQKEKGHTSHSAHHHSSDEKKKLLSKSELSIWRDRYEDIFSDFDSRPFTERTLSDDFILEAKKMARENPTGSIELKLLMPEHLRQKNTEDIIIKCLHMHFKRYAHHLKDEMKKARTKGFLLCILGMSIMVTELYLSGFSIKAFLINAIKVILVPAGWFFTWSGFDHIFYISRRKLSEYDFMIRMGHAEIKFVSF